MNIKWNWGTKLVVVMIFFMGLLVVLAVMSTRHSIVLVEKDYYPKGLKYQDRLDQIKNAAHFADQMQIVQQWENIVIQLPDIHPDTGSIVFFRPSGDDLDRTYLLETQVTNTLTFPTSAFKNGKYLIKIYWIQEGKEYYIEKPLYVN